MFKLSDISSLFTLPVNLSGNMIELISEDFSCQENQVQTKEIFSDKWNEVERYNDVERFYKYQREWFLNLYGFAGEDDLADYLRNKKVIVDTGCGLGYKAAWFAKLAPNSIVIGIDISDSIKLAAKNYKDYTNLFFLCADIADTRMKKKSVDFCVCDQVIMHTESPEKTFEHLSDITAAEGEFLCYVYAKKALPRELVDDYFRKATHNIPSEKMWEFSEQLTLLGKRLSELNISIDVPEIPLLGIKGGQYDIQRFIYWNFLKCFWKEEWGFDLCKSTNYDWYAPSNAKRFSKEEFLQMVQDNNLSVSYFHQEEACFSGRFSKLIKEIEDASN
ncbi:MAG: class I SAM-dependent methyltransferase [Ignavibacteriales bacterium]